MRIAPCIVLVPTLLFSIPLARAGDVTAVVKKGNLVLTGTGADDQLAVTQTMVANSKQFRLDPSGSTTVNGNAADALIDDVKGDLIVDLGTGMNSLAVSVANLPGSVRISAPATGSISFNAGLAQIRGSVILDSDGAAAVIGLSSTVGVRGDVILRGGAADNDAFIMSTGVSILGDVKLDFGAGTCTVGMGEGWVRGKLSVRNTTGGASISMSNGFVMDGSVTIATGADFLTMNCSDTAFGGKVKIATESAADSVQMIQCSFASDIRADLGAGANTFSLGQSRARRNLRVIGEGGDDEFKVELDSVVDGECRFDAGDGTNVLTCTTSKVGSMRGSGGAGADTANVFGFASDGAVRFDFGTSPAMGGNAFNFGQSHLFGDVTLNGGANQDSCSFTSTDIGGAFRARFGAGPNFSTMTTTGTDSIRIDFEGGADSATFMNVVSRGAVSLFLGEGTNSATLTQVQVGGKLTARAGAGDDTLFLAGNFFGKKSIDLGGGTNTVFP